MIEMLEAYMSRQQASETSAEAGGAERTHVSEEAKHAPSPYAAFKPRS